LLLKAKNREKIGVFIPGDCAMSGSRGYKDSAGKKSESIIRGKRDKLHDFDSGFFVETGEFYGLLRPPRAREAQNGTLIRARFVEKKCQLKKDEAATATRDFHSYHTTCRDQNRLI